MASLHIMHFGTHVLLDDNYNMLEFTMERYLVTQSQEMDYHYIGIQFSNGVLISVFFRNFCL
jgi:hypothetical protein